jgi:hypothetical protein
MTKPAAKSAEAADTKVLIVLGYDEDQKPRAARFPAADANLVAKAAQLMDLRVHEAITEELAAPAKKLPVGRLYSNGKGFVPNVRQNLYSQIIVELAAQPQAAIGKDNDELPVATGLPPGPGTRSRLATSSSPRKLWNTAGGKPSLSLATATCSRCGFGTTRSCPSSHAIVR